jgi:peptidoglycan/xylan/chitin deacetylase (PgdA/CDA1 family)
LRSYGGCIYDYYDEIIAGFRHGHQYGSHTWSHADLTTLSLEGTRLEVGKIARALQKMLGGMPTFLRPPYGDYNTTTLSILYDLGILYNAMWDWDSGDSQGYSVPQEQAVYNALDNTTGHVLRE